MNQGQKIQMLVSFEEANNAFEDISVARFFLFFPDPTAFGSFKVMIKNGTLSVTFKLHIFISKNC